MPETFPKRHNGTFQQSRLRQALYVSYRRFCKDVGLYRVSISQLYDLSRAFFKIKPNFTPFAVVVRLIQVDNGGYFFVPFAAFGLFQRHGMDEAAFQKFQP